MSAEQPIGSNAATKDAPPVGPRPDEQPSQHGRGRVGFFIGLGIVAMVVVAWVWVVTPAEINYWERRCSEEGYRREMAGVGESRACVAAAENLVNLGPRTAPAVLRLLRDLRTRRPMLEALVDARAKWALSVMVTACSELEDRGDRFFIASAAQDISGVDFGSGGFSPHEACVPEDEPPVRFLQWWEREGKTKYGGGGK